MNILDAILGGQADDDLDAIIEAVQTRRRTLATRNMRTLAPGATVRFNDRIKPTYLRGLEATVVKINQTTVTVEVVDKEAARRFAGPVRCPVTLIDF